MVRDAGPPPTMADLLPREAVVIEAEPAMWDEALLLLEERAAMARAVPGRRREYAAGRASARAALERLGMGPVPIPSAPDRSPIWPAGVVGSITHCEGYCAAAVARAGEVIALGIDAERHLPLPEGVERLVCTESERAWIAEREGDGIQWGLVLFSAKESFYKAWRPLARTWLDYRQAELTIDPDGATFEVAPLVPVPPAAAPLAAGPGRFALAGGHVLTAFAAVRSSP